MRQILARFKELKAQIAELESQAMAAVRQSFRQYLKIAGQTRPNIGSRIDTFLAADVTGETGHAGSLLPAKYRAPASGATWPGRGCAWVSGSVFVLPWRRPAFVQGPLSKCGEIG